jgi:hypothetical protein
MTRGLEVVRLDVDAPDTRAELDAFFAAARHSVVQQTCLWGDVIRRLGDDEPYVLGCRRGTKLVAALPAYRFAGALGAILTSVPQIGPLGGVALRDETEADEAYPLLLAAMLETASRAGCSLATVVTSPFWSDAERYRRARPPDFELENVCQVLDLDAALDDEGALRSPASHLRRNAARAENGALLVDDAQTPENVAAWYEIHAERHRQIGATPLPRTLFAACLERAVPDDKAKFFFVRRADSGAMVGGGLYVHHGLVVDALMPSVASAALQLRPSYLLALHSMRWARQRGLRFYNWQGSPPGGGVRRFKEQWGSRDRRYSFLTWVTGDVTAFRRASVADVKHNYPGHYVLPFDRIGTGLDTGGRPSSRTAAWRAAEGVRG